MPTDSIYIDGTYLAKTGNWHQDDSPWKAFQIQKILAKNKIRLQSIAEVGCGAGGVLAELSKIHGDSPSCAGYDISPQAIELAKKRESPNVKFHVEDFFRLDGKFDGVMAIDVFEHVENYLGFLKELKDRGTYKVFHIPLDLSVQSVLRNKPILAGRQWLGHIHYFTKDTAIASLMDSGYDIVDCAYTEWCFELPDRRLESKLLLMPRKLLYTLHKDFAVRMLGGFSLLVLAK